MFSNNAFNLQYAALVMSCKKTKKIPLLYCMKSQVLFCFCTKIITKGICVVFLLPTHCCLMIAALPAVHAELAHFSYTNTLQQLSK